MPLPGCIKERVRDLGSVSDVSATEFKESSSILDCFERINYLQCAKMSSNKCRNNQNIKKIRNFWNGYRLRTSNQKRLALIQVITAFIPKINPDLVHDIRYYYKRSVRNAKNARSLSLMIMSTRTGSD